MRPQTLEAGMMVRVLGMRKGRSQHSSPGRLVAIDGKWGHVLMPRHKHTERVLLAHLRCWAKGEQISRDHAEARRGR